MDQIELIIKLQNKNLMNYMLIGRSDKIEKLKERCEKISDVPPNKQILIYKGKILSNDKFISDYNIDNGDNIILKKKEKPSPINNPFANNLDISNLFNDFLEKNNISLSDNKEIDITEIVNIFKKNQDYLSFIQKLDFEKMNNYFQLIGIGNIFDCFDIDQQKYKQILNKNEFKDFNMLLDPSILGIIFNNPEIKKKLLNNRFLKFALQNIELLLSSFHDWENFQMFKILAKKDDEKSMIESSNTEIQVPPGPFENSSQILNSSGKI